MALLRFDVQLPPCEKKVPKISVLAEISDKNAYESGKVQNTAIFFQENEKTLLKYILDQPTDKQEFLHLFDIHHKLFFQKHDTN